MSDEQIYTAEELEAMGLEELQKIHTGLGLETGNRGEKRLRSEILEAQAAQSSSEEEEESEEDFSDGDMNVDEDPVQDSGMDSAEDDPETGEDPVQTADQSEIEARQKALEDERRTIAQSLNVDRYSTRDELEEAARALGVSQTRLDEVEDYEELWRLVKNAKLKAIEAKEVKESAGEGDLFKCNVRHNGVEYKKGSYYKLDKATRAYFREKYFI